MVDGIKLSGVIDNKMGKFSMVPEIIELTLERRVVIVFIIQRQRLFKFLRVRDDNISVVPFYNLRLLLDHLL